MKNWIKGIYYKILRSRQRLHLLGHVGKDCIIEPNVQFVFHRRIDIGNYVRLGGFSHLDGEGGLVIGDGTIIAPHVVILTSNHVYDQSNYLPYNEHDDLRKVTIGRGVWLGWGAKILPGVLIGDGAVIAMGAVVTKNVSAGSVVGGNPAIVIRKRKDLDFIQHAIATEQYYIKGKLLNGLKRKRDEP